MCEQKPFKGSPDRPLLLPLPLPVPLPLPLLLLLCHCLARQRTPCFFWSCHCTLYLCSWALAI